MNSRLLAAATAIVALTVLFPSRISAQEATPTSAWTISSSGVAEFAAGVAVGADSNPVVVGTECATFGAAGCQVRIVKYNATTGAQIWTYLDTEGGGAVMSEAGGVAIGPDGNPVVTFTQCDSNGANCFMVALKLTGAAGAKMWRGRNTAPILDFGKAIAVGTDNNVIVAGAICTGNGNTNCLGEVTRFNGTTGAVTWRVTKGAVYQMLFGVSVRPTGNTDNYVTGTTCLAQGMNCDITTLRLQYSDGATLTTRLENSGEAAGYFSELGWDVANRAVGDNGPAVTGVTCTATACSFRTLKYGATLGVSTWNLTAGGVTSSDAELGGGVAYANDNRFVVAGATCTPAYPNCSARIQRRNGSDGTLLWDVTLPTGPTSALQAVATGPDANPVAAGYTCNGASCSFVTSKQLLRYTTALSVAATRTLNINGGQTVADGMTVIFNRVTAAGNTTFQTSNIGFPTALPALPGGRTAHGGRYFQVLTTATTTGNTTVCLNYINLGTTGEALFQVYRYNGTAWAVITSSRTTGSDYLCGAATGGESTPSLLSRPA